MRCILALVLLLASLCAPVRAQSVGNANNFVVGSSGTPPAAPTFVATHTNAVSSGTTVGTTVGTVGAGNLLVVACYGRSINGGSFSVTDSQSNSYTTGPAEPSSGGQGLAIFYLPNATGGADTVTCHIPTAGCTACVIYTLEYSGVATSPFDTSATAANSSGSATSITAGPFTTTFSSEVIVAFGVAFASSATITQPSGYTVRQNTSTYFLAADLGVTSIQSGISATFSDGAHEWVECVATFKAP